MLYSCTRLQHTCAFPHNNHLNKLKNFKSITIKELAVRAGVSHSTVSRALNNHPAIARETAERIQQLARELDYVPNYFARSLKTNCSHMLGVIVHRMADPFYEILSGIQDVTVTFRICACQQKGSDVKSFKSVTSFRLEQVVHQTSRHKRLDGLNR
jgi:DNA-binding LacI/PurR family transcriptional regulator